MLHLPDVSYAQPNVNWALAAPHNGGAAIIKATEGVSLVDAMWAEGRRQAAHKAGVTVLGMYHFLDADPDPVAQAQHFVATVGSLKPGEFAIVDVEVGAGSEAQRTKAFVDYVDQHFYGGKPGTWVYGSSSFFEEHGLMGFADSKRHTWVAAYGPTPPSVPHTLWQYTDAAQWPGIPGPCDCSVYNGTLAQLRSALVAPA